MSKPPAMKKSDLTRARILEAARALFAEAGYDGASVREIAAAAAVDPALVIRNFGSKEPISKARRRTTSADGWRGTSPSSGAIR